MPRPGHITAFVLFFLISLLGMYIWTLLIRLVAENPYTAGAITPIQPVAEPDRIPRTILACLRSFAISKLSRKRPSPCPFPVSRSGFPGGLVPA